MIHSLYPQTYKNYKDQNEYYKILEVINGSSFKVISAFYFWIKDSTAYNESFLQTVYTCMENSLIVELSENITTKYNLNQSVEESLKDIASTIIHNMTDSISFEQKYLTWYSVYLSRTPPECYNITTYDMQIILIHLKKTSNTLALVALYRWIRNLLMKEHSDTHEFESLVCIMHRLLWVNKLPNYNELSQDDNAKNYNIWTSALAGIYDTIYNDERFTVIYENKDWEELEEDDIEYEQSRKKIQEWLEIKY